MRHLLSLTALATVLALAGPAEARHKSHRSSDDDAGQSSNHKRGSNPNALQQDKFKPAWERKDPNAHLENKQTDPTRDPNVARFAKAMRDPKNHAGIEKKEERGSKHRGMKTIVVTP